MNILHKGKTLTVQIIDHINGSTLVQTVDGSEPFRQRGALGEYGNTGWLWLPDQELHVWECDCVLPEQSCVSCREKAASLYTENEIPWRS